MPKRPRKTTNSRTRPSPRRAMKAGRCSASPADRLADSPMSVETAGLAPSAHMPSRSGDSADLVNELPSVLLSEDPATMLAFFSKWMPTNPELALTVAGSKLVRSCNSAVRRQQVRVLGRFGVLLAPEMAGSLVREYESANDQETRKFIREGVSAIFDSIDRHRAGAKTAKSEDIVAPAAAPTESKVP